LDTNGIKREPGKTLSVNNHKYLDARKDGAPFCGHGKCDNSGLDKQLCRAQRQHRWPRAGEKDGQEKRQDILLAYGAAALAAESPPQRARPGDLSRRVERAHW
jgi:hypothetical protein